MGKTLSTRKGMCLVCEVFASYLQVVQCLEWLLSIEAERIPGLVLQREGPQPVP